jgi:hypothetical protein
LKYAKNILGISLLGHLVFLFAIIGMHFLRPDKHMLTNFISEYAVGDFGWVMEVGFFGAFTGGLCLLIGLFQYFKLTVSALIALSCWCVGICLAGLFKTDVPGEKVTATGLIHGFSALIALLSLGIAMIVWSRNFSRNTAWKKLAKPSMFFGVISILLFVIFFMSPPSFRGLTQRILIAWEISWLLLINRQLLLSISPSPREL